MKKEEINLKPFLYKLKNKFISFVFLFFNFLFFVFPVSDVYAKCPENVVPNFLDPNCEMGDSLTFGSLVNRFMSFVPTILVIIFFGVCLWAVIVLMTSGGDSDKVKQAINILIYAAIAIVLFASLGAILFLISIITGTDIFSWIGL